MAIFQEQHGIRTRPISDALARVLNAAASSAGVDAHIFSGGQAAKGTKGGRTGSTRHDLGNAADLTLTMDGRTLSEENPKDLPVIQEFVRAAVENGATGIGAGKGYMGAGKIHVGFDRTEKKGAGLTLWGPGETSKTAPKWLKDAVSGHALAMLDVNPAADPFGVVRMQAAKDAVNGMAAGKSSRTLRKGMTGDDVAALQRQLKDAGLYKGKIDGDYGPKTQAAVRAAESRYGLSVDKGIAGPKVQAALANQGSVNDIGSTLGFAPPSANSPTAPMSSVDFAFGRPVDTGLGTAPFGMGAPPPNGVGQSPSTDPGSSALESAMGPSGIPPMAFAPPPMGMGLAQYQPGNPMNQGPFHSDAVPQAPMSDPSMGGPISVPTSSIGPDPIYGDDAVLAATRPPAPTMPTPSGRFNDGLTGLNQMTSFNRLADANARQWNPDIPSGRVPQVAMGGGPVSYDTMSYLDNGGVDKAAASPAEAPPLSLAAAMEGMKGAGLTPYSRGEFAPKANDDFGRDLGNFFSGIPGAIGGAASAVGSGIDSALRPASETVNGWFGWGDEPSTAKPSLYDRVPPAVPPGGGPITSPSSTFSGGGSDDYLQGGAGPDFGPAGGESFGSLQPGDAGYTTIDPASIQANPLGFGAPAALPAPPAPVSNAGSPADQVKSLLSPTGHTSQEAFSSLGGSGGGGANNPFYGATSLPYAQIGVTPWGTNAYQTPGGSYSNSPYTPMGYNAPDFSQASGGPTYAYQPNGYGGGTYLTSDGRVLSY